MNKKKNKLLILGILLLVIALITSVSYAIWQITLEQTDTNTVTVSCFKIEFQDNNPINLEKSYPIADEEGKKLIPYEFTIKNTCDTYASYQINLEILNDSTLEDLNFIKIMLDEDISLLTTNESVQKTLNDAHSSYKLRIGHLDALEEKTFHLRMWMDNDTPTDEVYMNKTLLSKIVVVTSYESDFDRDKPLAYMNITKEDNKIIVDASLSSDNTKILNYYYSKDGVNFIKSNDSSYTFIDEDITYGKGVESLIDLEKKTVNEVFVRVEDEYGNMSEIVSEVVGDMLYDKTIDNNLRYVGATPNNYVDFNGEKWRIIGVMNNIDDGNGNKDSRIKLIRSESIGEFASDETASNVNGTWGVNEWSVTKLKTLLNDYYYTNRSFTYKCAIEGDLALVRSCAFNGDGLKDETKNYIDEVVWNTGANETPLNDDDLSTYDINAHKFYENERSINSGKKCITGAIFCTDTVERHPTWTGRIGLIYPSDFGFATNNITSECRQKSIYWLREYIENTCLTNNWLNKQHRYWTMSPASMNNSDEIMFAIMEYGYVSRIMQGFRNHVYPVIYLKPNTKIISGAGTIENSYQLSLE